MNGQPPTPPPPPGVPPVQPAPHYYPPPRSGMGCFAKGCLTILILGFLCLAGVIGTSWYVFHKLASNNLISDAPMPVQLEQPSETQYQAADTSFTKLKAAANERREETVSFTAADLNALLARNSDFRDLSGHARVEIADSTMTISLSAPLDGFLWSSKKRRWFNGIVRFTGGYENGEFQINIDSARGGEYEVPDYILSRVNRNLSQVISDNTDEWRHEAGVDLRRIKRMSIEGDKLIVTTKAE
jgi:uncharacterized protein YdeI (BOF family)